MLQNWYNNPLGVFLNPSKKIVLFPTKRTSVVMTLLAQNWKMTTSVSRVIGTYIIIIQKARRIGLTPFPSLIAIIHITKQVTKLSMRSLEQSLVKKDTVERALCHLRSKFVRKIAHMIPK
jgi:hypothetical protein